VKDINRGDGELLVSDALHYELRKKLEVVAAGKWLPDGYETGPGKRFATKEAARFYARNRGFRSYTIVEISA
jgi:hypothetical protein